MQPAASTATPTSTQVRRSWQTASELRNEQFAVESSTASQKFSFISTGQGTLATGYRYRFLDPALLSSASCYRLRQIDTDGTSRESAVAGVTTAVAVGSVLPNPATTHFQV